jgi:hypothetical protein
MDIVEATMVTPRNNLHNIKLINIDINHNPKYNRTLNAQLPQ